MADLSPVSAGARHRVLWDGECAFCGRAARWCSRKDSQARLELVAYQAVPSPPMTDALRLACADALHVLCTDGRVVRGGRALLFVIGELGYRRSARLLGRRPLVWGVEIFYRAVAKNRRLLGRFIFRAEAE